MRATAIPELRSSRVRSALLHGYRIRAATSRTPALCAALALLAGFGLASAASPAGESGEAGRTSEPARPNILLLVAEDLGPRIGAFGDRVATTPNLDALAARGVRYPNTFTTAGVCAPSRAALITGVPQTKLGAQHMRTSSGGARYTAVPPPEVKAFPEILRAAGYHTFSGDKLDYQFSTSPFPGSGPFTIWSDDGGSDWSNRAAAQPFFGMVNFRITHESALFARPALPRSPVHALMQLVQAYEFWGYERITRPEQVVVPPYYPDTAVVRRELARFYDQIHAMDSQVGDVLERLEADGLAGSTIVIWTTDHGDGIPRHKREILDSGIRVPMIVAWPEALRPEGTRPGSVDERLVSFVDLGPTLLSWARVRVPDWSFGRVFAGEDASTPRRYVYAAKDRMDEALDRQRAVRSARYAYIRTWPAFLGQPGARHLAFRDHQPLMQELWRVRAAGALDAAQSRWFESPRPEEELYDVASDPHELRNLADEPLHAAALAEHRAALDAWLARADPYGDWPEQRMREHFWPGGVQPVTPAPFFEIGATAGDGSRQLALGCEEPGASIGYRIDGGAWQAYARPFGLPPRAPGIGTQVEAKAVRYGWEESESTRIRIE